MNAIGSIILFLLDAYVCVIVVSILISWLIIFEVINVRNEKARNLIHLLEKLTEPAYKPLRKYIPPIAGIDITPIILIFAISILSSLISRIFF